MERVLNSYLPLNINNLVCEYSREKYDFSELLFVTEFIGDEHDKCFKPPNVVSCEFVNTTWDKYHFYYKDKWPKHIVPKQSARIWTTSWKNKLTLLPQTY
jgi:hypothetical protein